MTPSRSEPTYRRKSRQTVPTGGCLSGFLIPPLVAVIFGILLAFLTGRLASPNTQTNAYAAPPAGTGNETLAPLFTPEIQFWTASLIHWAAQQGIDPNLAATVMQIESCGNPAARSSAGAAGLFQVMSYHFLAGEDAYNPDTNARRGLDYLHRALQLSNGDIRLALAGYNGGLGVIGKSEFAWPAETRRYVYWGSGIYADAFVKASTSARLDEWLNAGGASLCQKARAHLGIQ